MWQKKGTTAPKRIVRYAPCQVEGRWYVIDLLTRDNAYPKNVRKWLRNEKQAEKAAKKMNSTAEEKRHQYVALDNGFVAVSQGWSGGGGFHIGEKNVAKMQPIEAAYLDKIDRRMVAA